MNKYQRSIDLLNKAVGSEISTVLQYIYFHAHCEDKGYKLLSKLFMNTAIAEMRHIDELADRILFLGGDVVMHPSFEAKPIQDVRQMLMLSMKLEQTTVDDYNAYAKECGTLADSASHRMFEDLVKDEESHQDNFQIELDNMNTYGDSYLALQSIERSKAIANDVNNALEG